MARIAQHRPLEQITDPQQRNEAEQTRRWFQQVFLGVEDDDELLA